MDKNTLTGLLLMGAVVLGFTWLNRPGEEELAARAAEQSQAELTAQSESEKASGMPGESGPALDEAWWLPERLFRRLCLQMIFCVLRFPSAAA